MYEVFCYSSVNVAKWHLYFWVEAYFGFQVRLIETYTSTEEDEILLKEILQSRKIKAQKRKSPLVLCSWSSSLYLSARSTCITVQYNTVQLQYSIEYSTV